VIRTAYGVRLTLNVPETLTVGFAEWKPKAYVDSVYEPGAADREY
jgi:hypothetical protein